MIGHGLLNWGSYHYMFPSCYLWQVCLCSYHRYVSVWLFYFKFIHLYKSNLDLPAATGLVHLRNVFQVGDVTLLPIVWSAAVATGLNTIQPDWADISFYRLTVQQLGTGGGGSYMLENFGICWPSFWVVKRRPMLRIFFATTRPLPCLQETCLNLVRIFYVTIILMTS